MQKYWRFDFYFKYFCRFEVQSTIASVTAADAQRTFTNFSNQTLFSAIEGKFEIERYFAPFGCFSLNFLFDCIMDVNQSYYKWVFQNL